VIVAVTGATGFVGRHLTDVLVERGHRPRVLVRDPAALPFRRPDAVDLVPGSLAEPRALATLVAGAAAVVHLVGIIVEDGPATFDAVHVQGTRAVIDAARAGGVHRFVYMSAAGARDEAGATPYHRTKAAAEAIVRAGGLSHVIFRPSIISGPESAPIGLLARMHRLAPVIPLFGHGDFPTQPVWVGDVAMAFALAVEGRGADGTYELGGPAVVSYREFVRAIGRAAGSPRPLVPIPLPLVRAGTRVFDLLGARAPLTSDQLEMLVEGNATPSNAIESVFGIRPLPFEEGLKRYLGSGE
jgi:NADH dehydrogenase